MKKKSIPILDIYAQYRIPPNLQRHMFEVAAVGMYIAEHWTGPSIDKVLLTQALLLHDLGNIVKFKKPFLGELEKDSAHWENIQQETIEKYGAVAHDATEAMIRELGVIEPIQDLIQQMRANPDGSSAAESWEAKIADCADFCVSPEGIVGITQRLEDFLIRYELTKDDPVVVAWLRNAEEVQKNITVHLEKISGENFSKTVKTLHSQKIFISDLR
jgi:hypothetical protein